MTKSYGNDTWTVTGGLGLEVAADYLAHMCLEVDPPFAIGVIGKWGSGKTSIMRRAFATLGGQPLEQAIPLSNAKKEFISGEWRKLLYSETALVPELNWPSNFKELAENSFCVWYSPWQHQNENNPLIPLLLEIHAQFSVYKKIKKNAGNLNRRGGLAAIHLLEHLIDAAATLFAGKNIKVARGATDDIRKAFIYCYCLTALMKWGV